MQVKRGADQAAQEKGFKNKWPRILVAEDNQIGQFVIQELFNSLNIEITIVSNGVEVLEHLEKGFFHLVLMDIQMPKKDGFQTTKEIVESYQDLKCSGWYLI